MSNQNVLMMGMGAVGLALLGSANAMAADDGLALDEIIVTAEKRETTVQSVAAAISALSAESLEERNLVNASDLAGFVPNLQIGSMHREMTVSIRGVSSANVPPAQDSSVGMHYDGVYLPRPSGANAAFFDLERVEVLRGPQGTLYGRNTTGGTINLISNKPNFETEGAVELGFGNYDAVTTRGMLNIPIVDDKLAFRAAFATNDHKGYQKNAFDGSPDLMDLDEIAGRAHLLFLPTERLKMLFSANYYARGGAGGGQVNISLPNFDPYVATTTTPYNTDNRSYGLVSDITYSLDNLDIVSLTSYREDTVDVTFSLAAGIPNTGSVRLNNPNRSFSQELRLVSTWDKPLNFVIGGYFMDEQNADNLDLYFNFAQTAGFIQRLPDIDAQSLAAFAQIDLRLSDTVNLTLGGRYSHDKKHVLEGTQDFIGGPTNILYAGADALRDDWDQFTWKAALEWNVTNDNMLYGSVSTGYKAGGLGILNNFDSETLISYELGSKNYFMDRRALINIAAFLYDYDDLQLTSIINTGTNVTGVTTNAAGAEVYGIEMEGSFQLSEDFRVDATAGYLHSEFTSFPAAFDSNSGSVVDLTGNRLPRAPGFQATLGAQYEKDVGSGDVTTRVDLRYSSDVFFTQFNDTAFDTGGGVVTAPYAQASEGSYLKANASIRYAPNQDTWYVEGYVKNITDKAVIEFATVGAAGTIAAFGAPRTYGAKVGYKF